MPRTGSRQNLTELAFIPGGCCCVTRPDIMSDDLDLRGGYERVLTAMAGGARRRSRIAGRARIDYALDRLRRAGRDGRQGGTTDQKERTGYQIKKIKIDFLKIEI